jgi:excisionase family DNA binding protein
MDELSTLLDIGAMAQRLCVTERHVRRLVAERRIPYVKVGRFVRFDPVDIDDWISAGSRTAAFADTPSAYDRHGARRGAIARCRLRIAPLRRLVTSTGTGVER